MWELDHEKAKHLRTDAFELWCWRRFLRVLWTARRSNQSILKEIHPEYSLEGLILKLKLQYFGHLISNSFEKSHILGKIESGRKRGQQRIRWLDGMVNSRTCIWANSGRQRRTGKSGVLQSMGSQRVGHDWAAEQQFYAYPTITFWKHMTYLISEVHSWRGFCFRLNHPWVSPVSDLDDI